MLATDAHGGAGGIAQFNRNLLDALAADPGVSQIKVIPRHVRGPLGGAPAKVAYDVSAATGAAAFVTAVLKAALAAPVQAIYCGHINLAPLALLARWVTGAPTVLVIHGIDAWTPPPNLLAAKSARYFDRVIAVSEVTRKRFLDWSGAPADRAVVIPNSIRLDDFGPGPKRPDLLARYRLEGAKVVMTFGRMAADERYKGFDRVIAALPALRKVDPSIMFLAVGDGDDRPRLEALAHQQGVADAVRFTGRIDEADKADVLRLADAFALPSTGEGFGIVVLEALACGVPVVASAADGSREAVLNGALGQVVEPEDASALQAAILRALNAPKQVPDGLAAFEFDAVAARQRTALHDLLQTGQRH